MPPIAGGIHLLMASRMPSGAMLACNTCAARCFTGSGC